MCIDLGGTHELGSPTQTVQKYFYGVQINSGRARVALAFKLRGTTQATINTAKLLQAAGKDVKPMCVSLPADGICKHVGDSSGRTDSTFQRGSCLVLVSH